VWLQKKQFKITKAMLQVMNCQVNLQIIMVKGQRKQMLLQNWVLKEDFTEEIGMSTR
jgi:hypothetical protein